MHLSCTLLKLLPTQLLYGSGSGFLTNLYLFILIKKGIIIILNCNRQVGTCYTVSFRTLNQYIQRSGARDCNTSEPCSYTKWLYLNSKLFSLLSDSNLQKSR